MITIPIRGIVEPEILVFLVNPHIIDFIFNWEFGFCGIASILTKGKVQQYILWLCKWIGTIGINCFTKEGGVQ